MNSGILNTRKGIIAAGHPATAAAGAEVLENGGTAVDAAIAAAWAAMVAEPLLTGLGAGGFMLVHDAGSAVSRAPRASRKLATSSSSGSQTLLDFFVAMPGRGLGGAANRREPSELVPTPVDFGTTTQMFYGGHASVGVPGLVAGLFAAHERFGTMPMAELVAPAKRLATEGVIQTAQQAYLVKILEPVLSVSPACRELFVKNGQRLGEGDRFYHPDLPATLDELAVKGADSFYSGALAEALVDELERGGGYLTKADLAAYEVLDREPVRTDYRGREVVGNPPPSSGGALIAHTLRLLAGYELGEMDWHGPEHLVHLLEAQAATNAARAGRFDAHVGDEDALERLLAEEAVAADLGMLSKRRPAKDRESGRGSGTTNPPNPLGNTTHLSVIDSAGNAVSLTSSNGSGSGIVVPGTGILLNNILGEEDLNPAGFHKHPVGQRLTSMMAPTMVLERGLPSLVLGSAGSNRIRSAILQVISNALDFGMDLSTAVQAARVHVEGDGVELEGGVAPESAAALAAAGYQTNLWDGHNLFFGGVQAVARSAEGELSGAGDARRGGVAQTV